MKISKNSSLRELQNNVLNARLMKVISSRLKKKVRFEQFNTKTTPLRYA